MDATELHRLLKEATPLPWVEFFINEENDEHPAQLMIGSGGGARTRRFATMTDFILCAAAVNALPSLLDALDAAKVALVGAARRGAALYDATAANCARTVGERDSAWVERDEARRERDDVKRDRYVAEHARDEAGVKVLMLESSLAIVLAQGARVQAELEKATAERDAARANLESERSGAAQRATVEAGVELLDRAIAAESSLAAALGREAGLRAALEAAAKSLRTASRWGTLEGYQGDLVELRAWALNRAIVADAAILGPPSIAATDECTCGDVVRYRHCPKHGIDSMAEANGTLALLREQLRLSVERENAAGVKLTETLASRNEWHDLANQARTECTEARAERDAARRERDDLKRDRYTAEHTRDEAGVKVVMLESSLVAALAQGARMRAVLEAIKQKAGSHTTPPNPLPDDPGFAGIWSVACAALSSPPSGWVALSEGEVKEVREALIDARPHVQMATSITSGEDFREAVEKLLFRIDVASALLSLGVRK